MTNKNKTFWMIGGVLAGVVVLIGSGLYSMQDKPAPTVPEPSAAAPEQLPGTLQTEAGLDFEPEIKQRLLELSDSYEEQVQYPDFSLPIDKADLDSQYLPDIAVANELPARIGDPGSPGLSIKTSRLRYFPGDQMTAIATIPGLPDTEASSIRSRILLQGEALSSASVTPRDDGPHSYDMDFGSLQLDEVAEMTELMLHTEFTFQGETYERLTSIEYVPTIAELDGVGAASVAGEYLEIPVEISTDKPGYHRIKANLYDAATGEPLVHLRAEGSLESSNGVLVLRAHIAALKKAGSEGPYELKDLGLQRLPSEPDYITEYGHIEQDVFSITAFSFKLYSDQPYRNEKTQRIAKELRRLGS